MSQLIPTFPPHAELGDISLHDLSGIVQNARESDSRRIAAFRKLLRGEHFSGRILTDLATMIPQLSANGKSELLCVVCSVLHRDGAPPPPHPEPIEAVCRVLKGIEPLTLFPWALLARNGFGDYWAPVDAQKILEGAYDTIIDADPALTDLGAGRLKTAFRFAAEAVLSGRQPLPLLF